MKKQVNPVMAIVVILIVVIIAVVLFARAATKPKEMWIPGRGRVDPSTGRLMVPPGETQGWRGGGAQEGEAAQQQGPQRAGEGPGGGP